MRMHQTIHLGSSFAGAQSLASGPANVGLCKAGAVHDPVNLVFVSVGRRRNKRQELAAGQTQERGRQTYFPHCGFPQSTWTEEHGVGENIAPLVVRMTWRAAALRIRSL